MPWPSASRPSRRPLVWLALLAVTAGLAVPAGGADEPCRDAGAFIDRIDGWTEIRVPPFASAGGTVEAFAVVDGDPAVLLVTNGTDIVRSADGGCTWRTVHQGESDSSLDFTGEFPVGKVATTGLPRIDLLEAARFGGRAIAASHVPRLDGLVDLPQLGVLVSDDGGQTWQPGGQGLPQYGTPLVLRTSITGLATYLLVGAVDDPEKHSLHLSTDGGETWSARPAGDGLHLTRFEVDPIVPSRLWAWDGGLMLRSDDAGATFRPVPEIAGTVTAVDVRRLATGDPGRVSVFTADPDFVYASRDDGRTWSPSDAPGTVRAAASSLALDLTVTAADTGVHLLRPGAAPVDVTPQRASLEDVWVSTSLAPRIYGWTRTAMYRLDLDRALRPVVRVKRRPRKIVRIEDLQQARLRIEKSQLVPARNEVVLEAGETRTVTYRLDMAPTPTPLDVYFMTDSTGSMNDLINGLRQDLQEIVDELAQAGVDAWFGVADFKDYPSAGSPTDYPYRRIKPLGPPDDDLAAGLNDLQTGGGSGKNSALAALREAVTGKGQRILGDADVYYIAPGQDAGWRDGALHVIVTATDVQFSKPGPNYPGPGFEEVLAALNAPALRVRHVGLAVGSSMKEAAGPLPDLERVSEGTETFAPPGGVDCDDDGEVDVDEGQPLVCPVVFDGRSETRVAPALLSMLAGVEDFQPVRVTLAGDVARGHLPEGDLGKVNVKAANRFGVPVTFSCPRSLEGSEHSFRLDATVRGAPLAAATASLVCKPLVPPVVPAPAAIPPIALAAVPPPPPPPAPVTQVNPQPNPNPNPQPNPQPNVGAAVEEHEQPQLALAEADELADQELAMSARTSSVPEPALPLAAALLTALAGGAAVRTGTRTATATRRTRT